MGRQIREDTKTLDISNTSKEWWKKHSHGMQLEWRGKQCQLNIKVSSHTNVKTRCYAWLQRQYIEDQNRWCLSNLKTLFLIIRSWKKEKIYILHSLWKGLLQLPKSSTAVLQNVSYFKTSVTSICKFTEKSVFAEFPDTASHYAINFHIIDSIFM